MKVTRIETIHVDVPIVPEFQIRGNCLGSQVKSPFLLVRPTSLVSGSSWTKPGWLVTG
jgi:hypothetical protein